MRNPLPALLVGLLAACASAPPVLRSDVNPAASLGGYETFSFCDPLSTEVPAADGTESPLTLRLRRAVRLELEARGFQHRHAGGDLLVNIFLNVQGSRDGPQVPAVGPAGFYGYRDGRYRDWPQLQGTRDARYDEGTLSIDLVDAKGLELLWNGTAEGSLPDPRVDDPFDPTLTAAVAKVLALCPYRVSRPTVADQSPPQE